MTHRSCGQIEPFDAVPARVRVSGTQDEIEKAIRYIGRCLQRTYAWQKHNFAHVSVIADLLLETLQIIS